MTLPATGQISLSQVQTEFGGSNPISLSEYRNTNHGGPLANPGTYLWTSWKLGGLRGRKTGGWEGLTTGGSITVPAGVTSLQIYAIGGGGGGGWMNVAVPHYASGGGGGTGGFEWPGNKAVTPGALYNYTIGAGGILGGSSGGATTFGPYSWGGGSLGGTAPSPFVGGAGGPGGSPNGIAGQPGAYASPGGNGGDAGLSVWGNGGKGEAGIAGAGSNGVQGLMYIRWNS